MFTRAKTGPIASKQKEKCPECGFVVIVHNAETAEQICANCGLVISDKSFDRGPEWRAFTLEEKADRSRVGAPLSILQADKGLTTVIDNINKDAFGRSLAPSTRLQMLKLKKWQSRTQFQSSAERNLLHALSELDRIGDKLHLGEDLQEAAAEIYRRVLERDLVKGRSIKAMIAACIYAACRKSSRARSLKEVARVSSLRAKDVGRCYRLLLQELPIKMPIPDPIFHISKIAAKAGINERVQGKAMEILRYAKKEKVITGKDPIGMAAASLYIACMLLGEKKTQKEISTAASVTEVTVRNRCKGLREALKLRF